MLWCSSGQVWIIEAGSLQVWVGPSFISFELSLFERRRVFVQTPITSVGVTSQLTNQSAQSSFITTTNQRVFYLIINEHTKTSENKFNQLGHFMGPLKRSYRTILLNFFIDLPFQF